MIIICDETTKLRPEEAHRYDYTAPVYQNHPTLIGYQAAIADVKAAEVNKSYGLRKGGRQIGYWGIVTDLDSAFICEEL